MNLGLQPRYKYFSPRTGIAYRLSSKTVVRSGFGISYTPFPDNTWMYNFPVRSNNQYVAPSGTDNYAPAQLPGGLAPTFQNGFPAPDPVVVPSNGIITNPNPTTAQIYVPTELQERLHRNLEHRHPAAVAVGSQLRRGVRRADMACASARRSTSTRDK